MTLVDTSQHRTNVAESADGHDYDQPGECNQAYQKNNLPEYFPETHFRIALSASLDTAARSGNKSDPAIIATTHAATAVSPTRSAVRISL